MKDREATDSPASRQSNRAQANRAQAGTAGGADVDDGDGATADWAREALSRWPDAALISDAAGRLRFVNDAAVDLLGPEAVLGADLSAALRRVPPLLNLVREALDAGTPQSVSHQPAPPAPGTSLADAPDAIHADAPTPRLLARAIPLPGAACLLTVRPVADTAHDSRDLWQAEKMAALGRLAASVAHEVRNPLGAVDIQLQLLAEEAGTLDGPISTRLVERVDRARAEMRRLDGIVNNFLRFSRPPEVKLEPTDPVALVRRMVDLVEPEARSLGVSLRFSDPGPLPEVLADDNVLSQALLNVVINAVQAVVPHSDESFVEVESHWDGRRRRVIIEVRDNGCGIPAEDLERVLEFYYTTKDAGTGLGLSIAQGILQQHGGSLHLASRVGLGSSVTLALPAFRPPADAPDSLEGGDALA